MEFETMSYEAAKIRNEIDHFRKNSNLFDTENGEIHLLSYLYRSTEVVNPKMIALEMEISTARVARILHQLELKEMIMRKTSDQDRRQVIVELLPKGQDKYLTFKKQYYLAYENILRALGPEDAAEHMRIQRRILEIIKERKAKKCNKIKNL